MRSIRYASSIVAELRSMPCGRSIVLSTFESSFSRLGEKLNKLLSKFNKKKIRLQGLAVRVIVIDKLVCHYDNLSAINVKKTSHHFYFCKIMFQIMYNFEEHRDDHIAY